jgi:hypothetical protein
MDARTTSNHPSSAAMNNKLIHPTESKYKPIQATGVYKSKPAERSPPVPDPEVNKPTLQADKIRQDV